jgi:predicted TIM-barrel fold metal-dependent hydrolase
MPGGGGVRLKYGNPMDIDDVAVDFPEMPIIMAHPSFPWQDEAISICLHKPQVYIDLSGWSPKYFPHTNSVCEHALEEESIVRFRLPANYPGSLVSGLCGNCD